ncbi:MAG: Gfo/Idh/MocA family protein [Candidatus Spyradocola sp.]|jgi:predicted dehydrogenase
MALHFGILGAGGISRRFASVLTECDDADLTAVAARDLNRAEAFAQEFGAESAYGDYDALLGDPNVDAVYVGLTHNLHVDLARRALLAGKAVLCEKPMAVCAADARALSDLAREKHLLLMEGMWTRCMPAVRRATQWVRNGIIGPVQLLRASFCFRAPYDPQSRLYNPELCGGALLDAGVYPIAFALGILGEYPVETAGVTRPAETGVDAMDLFSLRFPSGAMAELSCAIDLELPTDAVILGTRGSVVVRDFLRSTRCELYDDHGDCVATFTEDVEDGFVYEIEHFCDLMEAGETESPLIPLEDTIACAEVFDALLHR